MNILIVKIGAIGDVVMCLPVVSRIREKHPQAKITWLCGSVVAPFLSRFSEIDKLIVVEESKIFGAGIASRAGEILRIWKTFAGLHFDETLYFYYSDLYKILTLPVRTGTVKRFNKNPDHRIRPVPARHHTFEYLSVLEGETTAEPIRFRYPDYAFKPEDFWPLEELKNRTNLIAISCGGAKNFLRSDDLRRWPVEHYHQLAQMLSDKGYTLILTGAASDAWVSGHFADVEHQNFIGKLNLNEFLALLSLCRLMITHDSGPLHLADIAGIPSIGLFGPTNPGDFRSLHPESKYLWGGENLACRPCYDGRTYAPCTDNICMKAISPDSVFSEIGEMLS